MKLFISADIEGCAGVALTDEKHKKESVHDVVLSGNAEGRYLHK